MRDLYTRALYKIPSQDLYERSPYKSSLQDLFTRPLWEISSQELSIDLFTRPLWEISIRELSTRSLQKTSMRDLFTRALYKTSSQDPIWDISIQDLLISLDFLGLLTGALYKISSQDLYEGSLYKSSLQDLFTGPHMRHLYTRSPDIPGLSRSPHRSSLQDLFTRPPCEISIQDRLISLDVLGLFTRALYKISSQDLYERSLYKSSLQDLLTRPLWGHLYTRAPQIPGLPRSPHRSSLQDPFTSPIWNISIQDLLASLDLLGLFTGALYKISSQDLYERSLNKSSLQDLFTRPLWEISIRELSTRSLHKTSMRDLFRRALCKISSQDLYERSLYKSSLQDLFRRPLWDISIQDLRISLDLLGLFTGALYKISSQDLYERSLYKISWYPWTSEIFSLQDLFKRPRPGSNTQKVPRGLRGRALCKISSQDLYERSLYRSSLQDLFTRPLWEISLQDLWISLDLLGLFTGALYKISSQDLYERSLYKILISLDLWDLLTTRSLQKTSIRIQHAESTERVARTKSKSAPRYSESDPTRTNSAEGCASWNKKCPRLSASDIPSAKWARRYSQSDPTRTKSREGCIGKHKIGTAPQRDSKNQSSDRTLTSELQYEMRFFDVLWRKYCACHEKMSPRHTKSCNCHAKWCQHSRSKFDDSFTKRAFRALQDRLQEHPILRLPRKMTIFHHRQFRATLTTILHTSQNPHVLHISGFPKIDTARRRERTPVKDLVGAPSRAGEMQIFDLEGTFPREGSTNLPHTDPHTTDLHQMLFHYRKNPIVWPHCLGKKMVWQQAFGRVIRSKRFPSSGWNEATKWPTALNTLEYLIHSCWLSFCSTE